MKICYISNLFAPYIMGGAETIATDLARSMKLKGHDVFVITTSADLPAGPAAGVKVYRFNPFNLYRFYESKRKPSFLKPLWHLIDIWNPHSYFTVRRILANEKPNIVHTHNITGLSPAVWSAAKHLRIPIIHTLHDCSLACIRTALMKKNGTICNELCAGCTFFAFFKRIFSKIIDVVISPSRFTLNILEHYGFFKNAEKHIINNGINEKIIDSDKVFSKEGVKFLFIGQIDRHKGIELLLKTFSSLPQENIKLDIVGNGELLTSLKKTYSNDRRISFYGFLSGEKKERIFLSSDVLAMPSICYESFPTVILEAYLHSMPVIGSRIGGIPELIEDGRTGFLFDTGDMDQLKNTMKKFIDNPNLAKGLSSNCIKKAQEYTLDRQADEYIEIYQHLVRKRYDL